MRKFLLINLFICFAFAMQCEKRLFDINIYENSTLKESLEELAKYCKFSMIIKDDLAREKLEMMQSVININQMSLDEIFKLLLRENDISYKFDGKVLKISALETRFFQMNYITSVREGQTITKASVDAKPNLNSNYAVLSNQNNEFEDNMIKSLEKFDFWTSIAAELEGILNSHGNNASKPIINENAGLIIVTGSPSQLERVQNYLARLENRLQKQVIIDVSIIAVNLNKSHSTGINWQNFNLNFTSNINEQNAYIQSNNGSFVKNLGFRMNLNFDSVLNFLAQNGETKVLSSPKLMALNNQQAIISIGDMVNYQVKESSKATEQATVLTESFSNHSIFVGILLNILPEISNDGKIMLRINPSLSDFKYTQDNTRQQSPRTIAPDIISKKLSTVVQVENNQSLILGGLISHNNANNNNSVNFLSQIPLLGWLFSSSDKQSLSTEIVFIITPIIVDNAKFSPSLRDLGFRDL